VKKIRKVGSRVGGRGIGTPARQERVLEEDPSSKIGRRARSDAPYHRGLSVRSTDSGSQELQCEILGGGIPGEFPFFSALFGVADDSCDSCTKKIPGQSFGNLKQIFDRIGQESRDCEIHESYDNNENYTLGNFGRDESDRIRVLPIRVRPVVRFCADMCGYVRLIRGKIVVRTPRGG
jgi:hypothetical protein